MLCFEVWRNGEKLTAAGVSETGVLPVTWRWEAVSRMLHQSRLHCHDHSRQRYSERTPHPFIFIVIHIVGALEYISLNAACATTVDGSQSLLAIAGFGSAHLTAIGHLTR
jgi:hypothetical protein